MNNDYWDYIGGRDYLAQYDENGNYIAHYGVKGMTWSKHKYKTVNPDGSYEYGTLNTGKGSLLTQHTNAAGSHDIKTTGTITRYTSNKKVGVNPNSNKFGISIKKERTHGTDVTETQKWRKTGQNAYATDLDKDRKVETNNTPSWNDHYLQVNYNKNKVDAAKKKVSNFGSSIKNKIQQIKDSRVTRTPIPGNAKSRIEKSIKQGPHREGRIQRILNTTNYRANDSTLSSQKWARDQNKAKRLYNSPVNERKRNKKAEELRKAYIAGNRKIHRGK